VDRIGRVVGERLEASREDLEARGVLDERLAHQAHAGKDHPAVKDTVLVEGVDRDCRSGVDDHARRRKEIGSRRAAPRGDERRPAIGAQLRRHRVAIRHAARRFGGGQPLRRQAPAGELALDAHASRLAGDVDSEHARRPRQVLPRAERQRADFIVGGDAEAFPVVLAAEAPFHPAVAGIDDENSTAHGQSLRLG
jgi:hypothetical protein